jgi:hypothetical protein
VGEHHTATGPGEERYGPPPEADGSCTEVAVHADATGGCELLGVTGVRRMPYRVMVADLRCATSTSIGDSKDS